MIFVHDNLSSIDSGRMQSENAPIKHMSLSEVLHAIEENDIIDLSIAVESEIIRIGASSDYSNVSGKFFDKLYYINEDQYDNTGDFIAALTSKNKGKDTVELLSIDGVTE